MQNQVREVGRPGSSDEAERLVEALAGLESALNGLHEGLCDIAGLLVRPSPSEGRKRNYPVKVEVGISVPGNLNTEDALSNLLQDPGESEEFEGVLEDEARDWVMLHFPNLSYEEIHVEVRHV